MVGGDFGADVGMESGIRGSQRTRPGAFQNRCCICGPSLQVRESTTSRSEAQVGSEVVGSEVGSEGLAVRTVAAAASAACSQPQWYSQRNQYHRMSIPSTTLHTPRRRAAAEGHTPALDLRTLRTPSARRCKHCTTIRSPAGLAPDPC